MKRSRNFKWGETPLGSEVFKPGESKLATLIREVICMLFSITSGKSLQALYIRKRSSPHSSRLLTLRVRLTENVSSKRKASKHFMFERDTSWGVPMIPVLLKQR